MYQKKIRHLAITLSAFICLTFAACGSGTGDGAATGDSVQTHRDDRSMSNQQHDGIEQTPDDSMMGQDTTLPQDMRDSSNL